MTLRSRTLDRRWLAWQDGAYKPFALPPPGDRVALGATE